MNELLQRYAELFKLKKQLEKDLSAAQSEMEDIEADLLPEFKEMGMNHVAMNGCTIRIDRKIWASAGGNMPLLTARMREAGLDDMVGETVNHNTLSAWVREHDPNGTLSPEEIIALLPPELEGAITVTEKFQLIGTTNG